MVTYSRILVWKIPWTGQPGGLQHRRWQRVGHDRVNVHTLTHTRTQMHKHPHRHTQKSSRDCLPAVSGHLFTPATLTIKLTISASSIFGEVIAQSLSPVQLLATPWTVAHQAPLSMEFSRREYWNGLSFASPGDLHDSGIRPLSLAWQVDSLTLSYQGSLFWRRGEVN